LLALILSVYWQVGGHAFVGMDDSTYVTGNPHVRGGLTRENVSWAFTTFHASNWHPLTWLSHMADVAGFGLTPGWHHRMNALLHLLNTELLFFVLWGMTGGLWESALVAALFGVHPLHVESVAWVSERKDVLSTLFWILTMGAYLRYVRKPGTWRYLLVLLSFALGLMCKPMLVTLPFVLLLLDIWPLRRVSPSTGEASVGGTRLIGPIPLRRILAEKVPLLLFSAASCVITIMAQTEAIRTLDATPFGLRLANSLVAYAVYLEKTVWPSSLAVFYPHSASIGSGISAWKVVGAALLMGGISVFAARQRRSRSYFLVGWLWFLGTLVPVIGLVQVGEQSMADRYTYVPLVGIFIALAWGISGVLQEHRFRGVASGTVAIAVLALALAARSQAGYWRDDITLFSRALSVTERNWLALHNLGVAYSRDGRYPEAVDCFREALQDNPRDYVALEGMGTAMHGLARYPEAIGYFREALRIRPESATAWQNAGLASAGAGRFEQALADFREAVRLDPGSASAWYSLGLTCYKLGRYREAIEAHGVALRIMPDLEDARRNRDAARSALDRASDATR
jgi:Flp pilus assembly protein TadD